MSRADSNITSPYLRSSSSLGFVGPRSENGESSRSVDGFSEATLVPTSSVSVSSTYLRRLRRLRRSLLDCHRLEDHKSLLSGPLCFAFQSTDFRYSHVHSPSFPQHAVHPLP